MNYLPGSNKSALVVDDSSTIRLAATATLRSLGFVAVASVPTGADALALLHGRKYDLIMVDHGMPIMTGTELVAQIRADPEHCRTPIVMLTGHSEEAIVQAARAAGVTSYLLKPLCRSRLTGVLGEIFAPARRTRQHRR